MKRVIFTKQRVRPSASKEHDAGWDRLCSTYDPMIRQIVSWPRWNFTDEEKNDVSQNIHLAVQSALPRFEQRSSLSWYIKQIAFRQCITEIRKQVKRTSITISTSQGSEEEDWEEMEIADTQIPDPHKYIVRKEKIRSLHLALGHMNETCRTSISMYYLKQLSYQEMATQLGIAVNTVGSRLCKCLDKLHDLLRNDPAFKKDEQ